MSAPTFTPTGLISAINQTLEYAYDSVLVVGEVSSYKVNQGKWVFFDLKDEDSSVSCFMPLWDLRIPLEDGMKVVARVVPKMTKWGKFSLTVKAVQPVGEGSLKKAFEALKKKLEKEGLFDPAKKRPIPDDLIRLGVISSKDAAGYKDFVKIVNARWGGMKITVAHTQVQGLDAPDQIIKALQYFNERGEVQAIAILRGGGSADDLACFNDENLVRAVAASRIPVVTGIGHEIDESLCDLAADMRASTPSNAAELLTRDRKEESNKVERLMRTAKQAVSQGVDDAIKSNHDKLERVSRGLLLKYIEPMLIKNQEKIKQCHEKIQTEFKRINNIVLQKKQMLEALNPDRVLKQGYAILKGKVSPGSVVKITTFKQEIQAEIKEIYERE